ncbi:MAG: hypothetical protein ACOYLQ_01615 [Hyphomicrobiaceae bacterium]
MVMQPEPAAVPPVQDAGQPGPAPRDATTGSVDAAAIGTIDAPVHAEPGAVAAAEPLSAPSGSVTATSPAEIDAEPPARKAGGAMWVLLLLVVAGAAGAVGYFVVTDQKFVQQRPRVASLPSPEKPESKSVESPDPAPGQSEQRLPGVRELLTEPSPAARPAEIAVEPPPPEKAPSLPEPEPLVRTEVAAAPPPAPEATAHVEPPPSTAPAPPVSVDAPSQDASSQDAPPPADERPASLPPREVAALAVEQPTPTAPVAAAAETADRPPRIVTATTWAIPAGTRAGLPLMFEPAAAAADHYVLLSGLEPDAFVSTAIEIIGGTWMVRGADLMAAEIERAANAPEQVPLLIELRANDGVVISRAEVMLGVRPATGVAASAQPQVATKEKQAENQSTTDVERLLRRGQLMLDSGSVGGARLLLERAAEMGSGEAALTLGRTYDPATLPLLGATGLSADRNLARRWYERAVTLGLSEGRERLKGLERD